MLVLAGYCKQSTMAYPLAAATARILSPPLASHSGNNPPRPQRRRINGSPSKRRRNQPSIAEIQRAIGVVDEDPLSMNTASSSSSSFLDLLSSTPIGQPEGEAERKLREAAEWMVDRTEANAFAGQNFLMVMCMKILPVWLLLLLVASGIIKLPFDLPFMDDLIS